MITVHIALRKFEPNSNQTLLLINLSLAEVQSCLIKVDFIWWCYPTPSEGWKLGD